MSRMHPRRFFSRPLTFAGAALAVVALAAFSQSFLTWIGSPKPLAQAFAAGAAQVETAGEAEREGERQGEGERERAREADGNREGERENPDDILRSIQRYLDGADSAERRAERRRLLELLLRDDEGRRRERRVILRLEGRNVETEERERGEGRDGEGAPPRDREVERDEVVTEEGDDGRPRLRILRKRFSRLEDLGERFGEELERALEDGARLGADEIERLKERGLSTLREVLRDLERAIDAEGEESSSGLSRRDAPELRPNDPVNIARSAQARQRDQMRASEIEVEVEKMKGALAAALEERSDEKVEEITRRIRELEREAMELRSRLGPARSAVRRDAATRDRTRERPRERSRELEALLRDLQVENDRLRAAVDESRAVAERERQRAVQSLQEALIAKEQAEVERLREREARERAEALRKQAEREAARTGRELPPELWNEIRRLREEVEALEARLDRTLRERDEQR